MQTQGKKRTLVFKVGSGGYAQGGFIGGSNLQANGYLYLDTTGEANDVRSLIRSDVLVHELGEGTLMQLAEKAYQLNQTRWAKAYANLKENRANTANGFSQTPAAGAMGVELADAQGLTWILQNKLYRPAAQQFSNNVFARELWSSNSLCGGTGCGGELEVVKRFAKVMVDESEAPIDIIHLLVGAESYIACGNKVTLNAGINLLRYMYAVMDPNAASSITSYAFLAELPPVGAGDVAKTIRRQLAGLQEQAITMAALKQDLLARGSNDERSSKLGRVVIYRTDMNGVTEISNIAVGAGRAYKGQLQAMLGSTRQTSVEIMPETSPDELRESYADEEFVKAAEEGRADEKIGEKMIPVGPRYKITLPDLMALIGNSPRTMEAYENSLATSRGVIAALTNLSEEYRILVEEAQALAEEKNKAAVGMYNRAVTSNPMGQAWAYLRSGLHDEVGRVEDFKNGLKVYREAYRDYMKKLAIWDALKEALAQVQVAKEQVLETPIRRLIETMDALAGDAIADVVYKPLEDLFPVLIEFSNEKEIATYLGTNAIESVSMRTLFAMLQMDTTDPRGLIERILNGQAQYEGPFWGAKIRNDPRTIYIVLPPMKAVELQTLQNVAPQGVDVLALTRTGSGLGIVTVETYQANGPDDIVTRKYRTAAIAARVHEDHDTIEVAGDPLWLEDEIFPKKVTEVQNA